MSTQSQLSTLINLSGKLRMLSHRISMCAALARIDQDGRANHLEMFHAAQTEFNTIVSWLQDQKDGAKFCDAARVLNEQNALPQTAMDTINLFEEKARILGHALDSNSEILEDTLFLADLVAGKLLASLNEITGAIAHVLEDSMSATQQLEESQTKAFSEAAEGIAEVSRRIRLISLNASVEAARAGEHGRGFGVISTEIRDLSEEAGRLTNQLLAQMDDSTHKRLLH